jgi:N-acetylglucosaminyl-diphospho-decaprenol L-rhamnosyltransferase
MAVSDVPVEPDWAGLACGWIRGEVVQQIGILDPGYFLYFDDVDYCRRARQAGWTVLYWPRARVLHYQGRSSPVEAAAAARKRRPRYFYASRSRYLAKMYGRTGLWWANVLWTLGRGIAYVRETFGTKQRNACDHELGDNWTHWRDPMVTPHLPYLRNPD